MGLPRVKIFPVFIRRIVGGVAAWLAPVTPGLALSTRLAATLARAEAGVAVALGPTALRIAQTPAFDLDATADGTAVAFAQTPALDLDASASGSPVTVEQTTGLALAERLAAFAGTVQTPALDLDASASGSPVTVEQTPALDLDARLAAFSGPAQTPAFDITQFVLALAGRYGAATATSSGNAWTNPSNGAGIHDAALATHVGVLLDGHLAILTMAYADFTAKSSLVISSVKLHFYVRQTGTVLNNGDLQLKYNLGAGNVALATYTGNVDFLATPDTYDITAAVGGDWTKLDALTAIVHHTTDANEVLINAAVDAVELEVAASVTQAL